MNIPFQKIIILDLGLVHIHIWGLMVALGLLAGLLVTLKLAKKYKFQRCMCTTFFSYYSRLR